MTAKVGVSEVDGVGQSDQVYETAHKTRTQQAGFSKDRIHYTQPCQSASGPLQDVVRADITSRLSQDPAGAQLVTFQAQVPAEHM